MPEKRMSKREVAVRARYFAGARAAIESFGATVLKETPIEGDRRASDFGPRVDYELLTDGGRLEIHLGDDAAMSRFDRPGTARKFCDCNPHSGKWNHHTSIGHDPVDAAYADDEADRLKRELERVKARPFVRTVLEVESAWVDKTPMETIREAEAFGTSHKVIGFDRVAAADEMASIATDVDGGQPEWMVQSNRSWMLRRPEIEAYASLREMRRRAAVEPEAAAPRPR